MAGTRHPRVVGPPVTASIVCGVADSPGARAAARFAETLARRLDLGLVLVHAVQPPVVAHRDVGVPEAWNDFELLESLRDAGVALVEKLQQELGSGGVVTTVVRIGGASDVIGAVAEEEATEFVVAGARGLGSLGKLVLGSVSLRLAADAPCPSVIVPDSGGTLDGGPIICAVDESGHSRRAVATAAMLAERLDTKLLLAHVEEDDTSSSSRGEELLARLVVESGLGTSVERLVLRGEPAEAIVNAGEAQRAEMIVIGSRGRGALASAVLGSVSSAVATRSTCPVTVVRDRSTPAAAERRS
jgi:nucleotide-binding universal stress UspA family protein